MDFIRCFSTFWNMATKFSYLPSWFSSGDCWFICIRTLWVTYWINDDVQTGKSYDFNGIICSEKFIGDEWEKR